MKKLRHLCGWKNLDTFGAEKVRAPLALLGDAELRLSLKPGLHFIKFIHEIIYQFNNQKKNHQMNLTQK